MPNIPGLPEEFADLKGVEMMPPPAEFLQQTNSMIHDAVAQLGPGDKFVTTWIANMQNGKTTINGALVAKVGDHINIVGYLGKTWGEPISTGIAGVWHF